MEKQLFWLIVEIFKKRSDYIFSNYTLYFIIAYDKQSPNKNLKKYYYFGVKYLSDLFK